MKVTILGSGSCYGVPTVGGDWGECDPNNPKNERTVASILIESETTKLLVDMGPDFREQSRKHNVRDLDAILFTHGHADHVLGNFHLPRLMQYYKGKNIPLYADHDTQKEVERVFWYQMNSEGQVQSSYGGDTHWKTIEPYAEFTIGDITVQSFLQEHGNIQSHGFRVGNFAYSTDFNDFPPESLEKLQGLDCWLLECNRKDASMGAGKHMYIEKALQFIDNVKPQTAYLTHLNATMDYDKISAALPSHVHLAYDGLELTF